MENEPLTTKKLAEVARLFGVSVKCVTEWRNARGMPRNDDGSYDLVAIHAWWREREEAKRKPSRTNDLAELETRKLSAECETKELKLEQARSRLVDRAAAIASVAEMFHRVRNRLQAAPEELASGLPAELRADYIEEGKHRVRLILSELHSWSIPENEDAQ